MKHNYYYDWNTAATTLIGYGTRDRFHKKTTRKIISIFAYVSFSIAFRYFYLFIICAWHFDVNATAISSKFHHIHTVVQMDKQLLISNIPIDRKNPLHASRIHAISEDLAFHLQ